MAASAVVSLALPGPAQPLSGGQWWHLDHVQLPLEHVDGGRPAEVARTLPCPPAPQRGGLAHAAAGCIRCPDSAVGAESPRTLVVDYDGEGVCGCRYRRACRTSRSCWSIPQPGEHRHLKGYVVFPHVLHRASMAQTNRRREHPLDRASGVWAKRLSFPMALRAPAQHRRASSIPECKRCVAHRIVKSAGVREAGRDRR